jgi:hypothetical protein
MLEIPYGTLLFSQVMSMASNTTGNAQAPSEAWRGKLEAIRDRHQVRSLRPEEEGFSIARLPAGVRGFTYAPGQPEVPVFANKTFHSFEVHKVADGTEYLIGFVTPSEEAALEAAEPGASINMFPDASDASPILVSVPVARILPPKRMPREDGNPFPFSLP